MTWTLTGLGIAGALLNALRRRSGFFVWAVANSGWIWLHAYRGRTAEVVLFGVYLVLALVGIVNWRRAPGVAPARLELPRV